MPIIAKKNAQCLINRFRFINSVYLLFPLYLFHSYANDDHNEDHDNMYLYSV